MDKIVINGKLAGLNEYISAINDNRYIGNKLKQDVTSMCALAFRAQCRKKFEKISVIFKWFEPDKRRDKDNIASAKKFIFDGMQEAGVIDNDNWAHIKGFSDEFYIDKLNPRVEVLVYEE